MLNKLYSELPAQIQRLSLRQTAKAYISIARPDHWFKNIFMLPGAALAIGLSDTRIDASILGYLIVGIAATCLIASANYTINEWLDAEFDLYHPVKQDRPSTTGAISPRLVYVQWGVLALLGLSLAIWLNVLFAVFAATLLFMGLLYNVKPIRTKDRQYLDVLSESVNNPLRFMLGWTVIINDVLPPSSVLLAFWMGGAFLMAIKRYAEFRFIGNPQRAGKYRRSFQFYTEEILLVSAFFYALSAVLFLGIFLIKYRIEFLIAFPFLALFFAWYLRIGMNVDSVAQNPEKLFTERRFSLYVIFIIGLVTTLSIIDLPWLNVLVDYHVLSAR